MAGQRPLNVTRVAPIAQAKAKFSQQRLKIFEVYAEAGPIAGGTRYSLFFRAKGRNSPAAGRSITAEWSAPARLQPVSERDLSGPLCPFPLT